jgi:hypothetical protein
MIGKALCLVMLCSAESLTMDGGEEVINRGLRLYVLIEKSLSEKTGWPWQRLRLLGTPGTAMEDETVANLRSWFESPIFSLPSATHGRHASAGLCGVLQWLSHGKTPTKF